MSTISHIRGAANALATQTEGHKIVSNNAVD